MQSLQYPYKILNPFLYPVKFIMPRHFLYYLAISFASLMLVSCATVKPQLVEKEQLITEPAGWVAEQHKRQQIRNWEIRGRLGVQTETNGGSLDIIWKQSDEDFSIRLIAPLGAGSYLIQGDSHVAEIRFPDGRKEIISSIDDAFSSALEVNLPANAVKDWLRGLPAKSLSIESVSWNDQGLLDKIKQSGWNVEMKKYTGNKILLPHILYLSRDDNVELDVRLVLRQWLIDK